MNLVAMLLVVGGVVVMCILWGIALAAVYYWSFRRTLRRNLTNMYARDVHEIQQEAAVAWQSALARSHKRRGL